MFIDIQDEALRIQYENYLKAVGSLSNLFSDSSTPFLYYRVAERIFCKAFGAEDLSRSDVSADAKIGNIGVGLKTFLSGNNRTFQKVAEFNNDRPVYEKLSPHKLIRKIAELRNARIEVTESIHNLDTSIYHCVLRGPGRFLIFEEPMKKIDIHNINAVKKNKNTIWFNDGQNDYSFLLSKSTLTKRFITTPTILEFDIDIIEEPFVVLRNLLDSQERFIEQEDRIKNTIYLPLYGSNQTVFPKSGLNQWNAKGRRRDPNEVYIPIPAIIQHHFPGFFPDRNTPFDLKLPNGIVINSKICQDGGKALMSHSNRELGQWILRDVLKLSEGELATYDMLRIVGIDSVRVDKISENEYEINFSSVGSFETFISNLI